VLPSFFVFSFFDPYGFEFHEHVAQIRRGDDFGELNELIREEWLVGKCKFGGVFW